jgi:acetyltransferase
MGGHAPETTMHDALHDALLDAHFAATRPVDDDNAGGYPWHLVERLWLRDGSAITVRPIRASDLRLSAEFVAGLSKETRYQRLLSGRDLLPGELERLTDIDHRREMALIATICERGRTRQIGVARYVPYDRAMPVQHAEIAIVIADAWQRRGLGERLLGRLVSAAADAGLRNLSGLTLATNQGMRSLALRLGFTLSREPGDATLTRLVKAL